MRLRNQLGYVMTDQSNRNALPAGYKLHWYEIESILGQGGFGITYLARDTNLDRRVAIKEYLPSDFAVRESDSSVHPLSGNTQPQFEWGLDRFISEAKILSKFEHPNIVRVFAVFEENNTGYLIMPYEEGKSLYSLLKGKKTLDQTKLLKIIEPILDGLELVHQHEFIHRDIKPDNIFIREDGSPVLLDFGSARQSVTGQVKTLTTLVSPGYAPFEQYYSKSDEQGPWTDIYGLGATLYRAISGRAPLDAVDRSKALLDGSRDTFCTASEVGAGRYSEDFLKAIDHAISFKPIDRPQSISEWRDEFEFDQDKIETQMSGRHTNMATEINNYSEPKKKKLIKLFAGLIVLIIVIASVFYSAVLKKENKAEIEQKEVTVVQPTEEKINSEEIVDKNKNTEEGNSLKEEQIAEKIKQQEAETKRLAEIETKKKLEEERLAEEQRRLESIQHQEAEAKKRLEEIEAKKKLEEERLADEQHRLEEIRQQEEEAKRLAEIEAARKLEEERLAEEQRKAEEIKHQEEEAKRLAELEAAQRLEEERLIEEQRLADIAAQYELEAKIAASRAEFGQRYAIQKDTLSFVDNVSAQDLNQANTKLVTASVVAKVEAWQNSGVEIKQGSTYKISATGTWQLAPTCPVTGPTGDDLYNLVCWDLGNQTVANRSHAALIGKIGKDALAFYVGDTFSFTAESDGVLYLMCNDAPSFFFDNAGALNVSISLED